MKIAALLMFLAGTAPLGAMTQDELLHASLLPGWRMQSGHHMAGLALALAPGWKTYWRRPGEAGIPPVFDWSGSQNVASVRVHWPSPVVFHINGMQTVGYKGGVVLPLEVLPKVAGQPMQLKARVDLGICNEICMPAEVILSADLAAPGQENAEIHAALQATPIRGSADLGKVACAVAPIADGLRLTATVEIAARGGKEGVVIEPADPTIWVSDGQTSREGAVLTTVTEMVAPSGVPFALDRSGLRLTVLGGTQAVEIQGCPAP